MSEATPDACPPSESSPARLRGWLRWWLAAEGDRPEFYLSRWLFLRLLGLVYVAAFLSYAVQVAGLIGTNGLLPADAFVQIVHQQLGANGYWLVPSLYWLYPHDAMLHILCWGGVVLGALLVAGIAPTLCLALLWIFYLSLVTISQDFLSFQWDSLLLEVGFIAVFFAPFQWWPRLAKEAPPSLPILLLLWWVLFRLMFGSGVVKLDDETWTSLTALAYHYETQPLPSPLAWYAAQMPLWFHELATAAALGLEIIVPLLIFTSRRPRAVGALLLIGLQAGIMLTGNFAFFNWLAIAMCVLLLDDRHLRRVMPKAVANRLRCPEADAVQRRWKRIATVTLVSLMIVLGMLQLVRLGDRRAGLPEPLGTVVGALEPFHLTNSYGLFAVMTTFRPEIVIEGSNDGENWKAYEFKDKPGAPDKPPRWIAPHQPRLDWQMWFAALGPFRQAQWFPNLMVRLLQGQPEVLRLLKTNPFPDAPPRYVRATLYSYAFTRREDGKAPAEWWVREETAPYFPQMSLGVSGN